MNVWMQSEAPASASGIKMNKNKNNLQVHMNKHMSNVHFGCLREGDRSVALLSRKELLRHEAIRILIPHIYPEQAPHNLQELDFAWILVLACAFQVSQGGQVGIWARTGCTFDESGNGTCQTGDCGGRLECNGMGATPPASLFEVTLGTGDVKDYYDVSLVDGYNLPLVAAPVGVHGECNATGCVSDINMGCPKELQLVGDDGGEGGVVACKSACEAFGLDQYCCGGEFANPTTCQPSFYSTIFKRACPRAYSYAFDDGTSIFTCKADDYAIIFCPTANGVMLLFLFI
ncbi:hypothetical protein OIU84_007609 [Salix udensis]|uniref:Thaumatin-like protein n=1 Tax=Salix udensis TaxID=889485 RepID=A0AAD6JT78_9ROSI|nr:hypothetical protein OIU84_007609 [Salix udensis]